MPPSASKRRTSSKSFDRIEGEGPKAFAAFAIYRDMGPDRTLDAVRKRIGHKGPAPLFRWSSEWNWVERAGAFDDYIAARAREIAAAYLPFWEARRQVMLERMMLFAEKLLSRAEAMLDHPITREVTKESADGRTIYRIITPAKWTWAGLAQVVKVGAELQSAVIAEGLAESADEGFDVESATPDQLREFLDRTRARAGRSRGAKG